MALPSLDSVLNKAILTFNRFPLAITSAVIATFYMIRIVAVNYDDTTEAAYGNVVMTAYLGMLLFIAISLYAESKRLSSGRTYIINLSAFLLVTFYFFSLPDEFTYISGIRFFLIALGLHLLISFISFFQRGNINGFWQFNKTLFIRILTAGLYTLVLFAGLALAILAIDKLFNADINDKIYANLWFILAGIFNTWLFLAGVPMDYEKLDKSQDYPKGLKIFTQYILVPLISIYLIILYSYTFKIIFTWQWPQGWVSYLVLGFSIGGILSLLLIYPVRNEQQNKWMLTFSRFFYFALLPLVVLLFFAIKRRISEYGITEERYFVLLLALWLLFISLYFLFSKNKNIKLIPASLCIVCFLSAFGPWSAFDVSRRSQEKKLLSVLERNHMVRNGKIIPATGQITFKENDQIISIIQYITKVHGYRYLQPYFSSNLDTLLKHATDDYNQSQVIMEAMKINYRNQYDTTSAVTAESPGIYFNYSINNDQNTSLKITGFEYYLSDVNLFSASSRCRTFILDSTDVTVCIDRNLPELLITAGTDTLKVDLKTFIDSLPTDNRNNVTVKEMSIHATGRSIIARIIFSNIYGRRKQSEMLIDNLTADILLRSLK